jgi:hypothetical protein
MQHNKSNIKDEDVLRLHPNHSFSEIARILGCSRAVVVGRARKYKLKSSGFSFSKATNLESQIGTKAFSLLNDETWLRDQYIIQNKSTRQIASEISCGKKAVTTALRRYKVPIQSGVNKNKEAQIRRGFLQNVPTNAVGKLDNYDWMYEHYITKNLSKLQIAGICGVSQHCVHCWTKKHKLLKSKVSKLAAVRAGFFAKYGCEIGCEEMCRKWMRSRHGEWIDTRKAGKVFCHSSWELAVALRLDSLDAVISFSKEGIKVDYIYLGNYHMYFPDFVIRTLSKTAVVEVKPTKLQQHPQNIAKINALKVFCDKLGWDYFVVGGDRKGVDLSTIDGYFR